MSENCLLLRYIWIDGGGQIQVTQRIHPTNRFSDTIIKIDQLPILSVKSREFHFKSSHYYPETLLVPQNTLSARAVLGEATVICETYYDWNANIPTETNFRCKLYNKLQNLRPMKATIKQNYQLGHHYYNSKSAAESFLKSCTWEGGLGVGSHMFNGLSGTYTLENLEPLDLADFLCYTRYLLKRTAEINEIYCSYRNENVGKENQKQWYFIYLMNQKIHALNNDPYQELLRVIEIYSQPSLPYVSKYGPALSFGCDN